MKLGAVERADRAMNLGAVERADRAMNLGAVERADRAGAFALFALLLALYTLTFSGLPDNPDAEVEFQTTRSLARHGSLALGDTPEARAIVAARFDVAPGGPGREDRWYSWFGVGQAFVAVPFYAAGACLARVFPEVEARHAATQAYGAPRSEYWQHLLVGWRNPLLAAATAALLALAARRLGASRGSALLAALAYGTATFAWPQARSTLSDVQATFCLALAFERWLALRAALRADARAGGPRAALVAGPGAHVPGAHVPGAHVPGAHVPGAHVIGALVIGAGALALAVLTRIAVAPAAAVLAAAFALELLRARARPALWLAFATPLALGAAVFTLCNQARFGSAFATGYGAGLSLASFFSYPPLYGLAGLLAAPGKGLAWMAPLLLLVPIGCGSARARGERAWPVLAALFALAVLAPVAATQTWHGAWTYGPRYALPLLPIVWPAVALAFDRARARASLRVASVLLAALGFATTLPGVLVDHMTHQDLAVQAARVEWTEPGGADERERDAARFLALQWSWRFAAPWAHWRIAFARAGGAPDVHSARELFGVDSDLRLEPQHDRERGLRHLAWVDLEQRLDGPAWLGPLAAAVCLAGALLAWRRLRALTARPEAGPDGPDAQAGGGRPR